ncbi:MAG: phage shock protein operon transcriptional activator [Spirochaetales bacterium]|uniref:Phage shock protein operon transcriptional activator n=1 Tax=Candidatus Thalassospirochaeta sargassi TaxID=3119039 RepID=A0AAJ1MMU5_9SPIO|nr:phage shock protein operon transcriptional activator [Spirochaetales bacterium]
MNYPGFVEREALGESEIFLNFQAELSRAAGINRSVMIIGERGTGKELAASRLHYLSERWEAPFVTLNCAALPSTLIETELFGHSTGAYTGAGKARKGRFEEADGGTLFLDEMGLIPLEVQEKILRVVEYGSFERVGSSKTVEVDVRIVAATNQNMPELCEQNKFKRDLLDRLSFEVLFLPPLRERGIDKMLLAEHFAIRMSNELGRPQAPGFSDRVREIIETYSWPGNIRELKNVVERAVYKCEDSLLSDLTIDPFVNPYSEPEDSKLEQSPGQAGFVEKTVSALPKLGDFRSNIREIEISYLKRALAESENNQRLAADKLALTYDQFRGLYRKYREEL